LDSVEAHLLPDIEEIDMKTKKFKASIKVMNSYDYSHFEASLASDKSMTIEEINGMRKVSQRLVDEAIRQYKVRKQMESSKSAAQWDRDNLRHRVELIKNKPESEWSPQDKADVKLVSDRDWQSQFDYDYEDDWGEEGG
jgi:hypothetical protein